jgi:Flp pilus assembly protein TadG
MKRIMISAAVIAASLSLAACGITRQEANAIDDSTCHGYGLKYGTPEFAQCRMAQDQRRDAAGAAARANAVGALQQFNNTVQSNDVPASVYAVPPMQPIGPQRIDVYRH